MAAVSIRSRCEMVSINWLKIRIDFKEKIVANKRYVSYSTSGFLLTLFFHTFQFSPISEFSSFLSSLLLDLYTL